MVCANLLSLNTKRQEFVLFNSKKKKVNTRLIIKIIGAKISVSIYVKNIYFINNKTSILWTSGSQVYLSKKKKLFGQQKKIRKMHKSCIIND